eukprot:5681761-Alexandrium_andersonii.AAC.1
MAPPGLGTSAVTAIPRPRRPRSRSPAFSTLCPSSPRASCPCLMGRAALFRVGWQSRFGWIG